MTKGNMVKGALGLFAGFAFFACASSLSAGIATNTEQLYELMRKGEDVSLQKGKVYEIVKPLNFTRDGQKLTTMGATRLQDYAILRVSAPEGGQIINGNNKNGILLEKVVLDGNRYNLPPYDISKGNPEMAFFGGGTARDQKIKNCVFMNSRTWSTFKLHEGAKGCSVENSIFFGGGADVRGNGRSPAEKETRWGDGISCAAAESTVKNNIIIDPTDVGIVIFCAPGTLVENNVIASVSRESLGGINMVDGIGHHEMDKASVDKTDKNAMRKYNYTGVVVKGNYVDAFGARIHIAFPMGATVWVPKDKNTMTFYGAHIIENTIAGEALGYGFVADGIEDFVVSGNKCEGKQSGLADGRWDVICDEPLPMQYNPDTIGSSKLQAEFVKQSQPRALQHLLRCNHGSKSNTAPYREIYKAYSYGVYEAPAAVKAAYLEMLGRDPSADELRLWSSYLNDRIMPVEDLRYRLMKTEEFQVANGKMGNNDMHNYRTKKWMSSLDKAMGANPNWKAKDVYKNVLKSFYVKK